MNSNIDESNIRYDFGRHKYYGLVPTKMFHAELKEMYYPKKDYSLYHLDKRRIELSEYLIPDKHQIRLHVGDIVTETESEKVYEFAVNDNNNGFYLKHIDTIVLNKFNLVEPNKRLEPETKQVIRKMIPYPSNCSNCGAVMSGYTCRYCGTHYPEYK